MAATIREKQIASLKRMLNLNVTPSKSNTTEPVWKILVYDRFGQDIISPLLSVRELREMGITLHFFQRPLLVMLDRNMDLATPLHHTWTYQALAHDVLDLQLNQVVIEETVESPSPSQSGARPKKKTKTYDLNPKDKFWNQQKGSPFPTVAEAVQSELEGYRASEDEVKRLKSAMGLEGEDDSAISMISDNTAKITSAVSSLPELLERKRVIDMHTNIASAVLDHIKARKLDIYFEMEEKLMGKSSLDKSILDMINDPDAGTAEDKIRLFIIFYICGQSMTDVEFDQYASALEGAGCNLAPLYYVKRWKAYTKMAVSTTPNMYGGGGTKTVGMFSKLMSQGSSFVMEGVKNLVVKRHNLPVTKIVDALMEIKSNQETDDYRYFDPKMLRVTDSSAIPRNRTPFQEALVFVVGGGNYIEYQNLVDYVKNKTGAGTSRHITYGCSELLNAAQFLRQLSNLGQESH
ncbi:sec1 family domain-containing protein 1-like [Saccoglossus kowalevskii]|uniref:Sec1 family domain-containing protein 1-like n=1 Tax=Saccoglossus kowalevskii TaxID=10224 RepID=A0ABM0GL70_SACKO|nr:PREDICTED: sec1 family domain-containing protein 1-like [Saccoglossus kowalevskii]